MADTKPIDEFGFDPEYTVSLKPIADLFYRHYWRVEVSGMERIPEEGPCILVANHAGILPFDAAMIKTAVFENPPHRHVRVLMERFVNTLPFINILFRRTGNVLACRENAIRLLNKGEVILVFPEGIKGVAKLHHERYKLRRFGRGGVAHIALQTGAPIIPIAVVGSEEIYHLLAKPKWLGKLFGLPFLPITPTFPWLGPLGVLPLPTKWYLRVLNPVYPDLARRNTPDADLYVQELSESLRQRIQQSIHRSLQKRRSVFFG